jgi:hypothetical protein
VVANSYIRPFVTFDRPLFYVQLYYSLFFFYLLLLSTFGFSMSVIQPWVTLDVQLLRTSIILHSVSRPLVI